MNRELIFVTGYFGAPIKETAGKIAENKGYELLSLDNEIEKSDGRSVLRICMMMGEHEYRNKEYELLKNFDSQNDKNLVIYCGDGVLNDEMSFDIMKKHNIVIAGTDMTTEQLWANAKNIKNSYHAFLHFGSEDSQKKAFEDLYARQNILYRSLGLLNE